MDKDIQRPIEIGELNRATTELVRNWCAHVRIVRYGGIGLIEEQTGLPIGPHGLACDFAAAGGVYTPASGTLPVHRNRLCFET